MESKEATVSLGLATFSVPPRCAESNRTSTKKWKEVSSTVLHHEQMGLSTSFILYKHLLKYKMLLSRRYWNILTFVLIEFV